MRDRRDFLKLSALAAAGLMVSGRWSSLRADSLVSPALRKFIQPLPMFGREIPIAAADTLTFPGTDFYNLTMSEYVQSLHPDLPKATRLWGYANTSNPVHRHLGGAILAKRDRPVRVRFTNALPATHILPLDETLEGASEGANRAVAHLHGGHVPWPSDGGPFAWKRPDGRTGSSHVNWLPDVDGQTLTDDHWYPNDQSTRLMWFHDHAMGTTRLNAYAGLASAYVLRDDFEYDLIAKGAIPGAIAGTEIPLVIQDKRFKQHADAWGDPGDLDYPSIYDADTDGVHEPPEPSAVPEFFGDTMLMNGVVYPYVDVQQRRYRFRILNACNARFCNLQLYYAQGTDFPSSTEPALHNPGPNFLQIGTEGGFLSQPVLLRSVLLAPAERADVIVDFSEVPAGARLILYNDAAAPFPMGGPETDFFTGSRLNPGTQPGFGPNTRTLMQFHVIPRVGARDPRPTPLKLPPIAALGPATVIRNLTLNEDFDDFGRLLQRLGTNEQTMPGTFGRRYMDAPTETPLAGAVEVWRVFNLTMDTHPIHMHLTNAQVLSRRRFQVRGFDGAPHYRGHATAPDSNELGWKETIRMRPGEMTEIKMQFDLAPAPPGVTIPPSPRTGGHEYVWHCHILEHEEHDMMRPLIVT
jgi:spore coat protein A, manganese oxidase